MNLHVMPDDKFIDGFIELYEKNHSPSSNLYISWKRTDSKRLIYIKNSRVKPMDFTSDEGRMLLTNLDRFDAIYFHSFSNVASSMIDRIPKTTKVLWIFWGVEYYIAPLYQNILDKYAILEYLKTKKDKHKWLKIIPDLFLKKILHTREKQIFRSRFDSFGRVDYFLHWNRIDYDLIKQNVPPFKAEFIKFGYGSTFQESYNTMVQKKKNINILLGNSASLTNNHVSILHSLSKRKESKNITINCPLSYGDSKYGVYVQKIGEKLFGDRFIGLRDFLPRDDYFKIYKDIDYVVMNHLRTQGGGNVAFALLSGKKVFMNPGNTQYLMFKKMGVYLYSNNLLKDKTNDIFTPLTKEEQYINHTALLKFYNSLIEQYKNLI